MTFDRWSVEESLKLAELRNLLGSKLTRREQFPDVVGDRRLVRFLRGCKMDVNMAYEKYSKFLDWRDANSIDDIRNDILYNGKNDPNLFPSGGIILECFPQIIIAADACDFKGNPISVEKFNFSPSEFLKRISSEEYIRFVMYCLEYKVLILEQLSDAKERTTLANLQRSASQDSNDRILPPYGAVLCSFYFRDFEGFSLEHVGGDGQKLLGSILEIATANYPELLYKSHMMNVPWIFNMLWIFVKPFLDNSTIAKISIHSWGSDFISQIQQEIALESIPECFGGTFTGGNAAFSFDISPDGPFSVHPTSSAQRNVSSHCNESPRPHNDVHKRLSDDQQLPSHTPAQHRLLKNPKAWLLYLRIKLLAPIATTGMRLMTRLYAPSKSPVLSALVSTALVISASTLLGHACFQAQKDK